MRIMNTNNISKENKKVMMRTIISSNKRIQAKIKSDYPKFTSKQLDIALLLSLEYSVSETAILLDVTDSVINEVLAIISST